MIQILEEAMQIARLLQLLVPLLEHGGEQLPDLPQLVGPLPNHHRLLGVRDRDLLRLLVKRLKLSLKYQRVFTLKRLSHEMDFAFEDLHGQF